jgi:hypothetical protein
MPPLPSSALELDAEILALGSVLARRDLQIGRLARRFCAVRGWSRLGYASLRQYAEERVGVSVSSIQHRMLLARRCDDLPEIGAALDAGQLGYEAALLIGRIATPDNVDAWILRAQRRTVVQLRQEVDDVELRVKLDPRASLDPPDEDELAEVAEFRRSVQSGEFFDRAFGAKPEGLQMSVTAGSGREVRFRLREEMAEHFHELHHRFRTLAPRNASFIGFLVMSLWHSWLPALQQMKDKWQHIYLRDGFQCQSPVCTRRDVTPHHLRYQSHGGGHEDENLISLCSWCHLHGIHGGRIRATPPASNIRWAFGRQPVLMVHGRDRIQPLHENKVNTPAGCQGEYLQNKPLTPMM